MHGLARFSPMETALRGVQVALGSDSDSATPCVMLGKSPLCALMERSDARASLGSLKHDMRSFYSKIMM